MMFSPRTRTHTFPCIPLLRLRTPHTHLHAHTLAAPHTLAGWLVQFPAHTARLVHGLVTPAFTPHRRTRCPTPLPASALRIWFTYTHTRGLRCTTRRLVTAHARTYTRTHVYTLHTFPTFCTFAATTLAATAHAAILLHFVPSTHLLA